VRIKVLRKRQQFVSQLRLLCPVSQHLVLSSLMDVRQPLGSLGAGDQDDIRHIARAKASADRQMNPLQESSVLPLLLQPFDGDFGVSFVDLPAAAAVADADLTKHGTLG
jgi:hypothetical protein